MNCLFCKIIAGEIPTNIIYQNDHVLAFNDINPQAPHHLLIIPRKHISTLNDIQPENSELIGHMSHAAKMLANQLHIAEEGYRLVINCNAAAGQTVFHIHMHLLGGRHMAWPPG